MIGKIFRAFSNDWKIFSVRFRATKGTKGTTTQARRRLARPLRQFPTIVFDIERRENRFADKERLESGLLETTWTTRAENGWEIGWRLGARASRPRRFRKAKTCRKSTCFPQSPIQRRGWKPHLRKSRDACPKGPAPLPGVRHLAAPNQGENARPKGRTASCHFSLFTCHCARRAPRHPAAPKRMESGRKREKEIYKNVSNAAARPRMAGRREGCLH